MTRPGRWRSELLRGSLFRLHAHRQRPQARRYWRALRALEYSSYDHMEALQAASLRTHLVWACAHNAYYRQAAQECGFDPERLRTAADLAGFPVLTRALLRGQGARLLTGGRVLPHWLSNASGGSTGEPVSLYQDPEYWNQAQAAQWFMESWWGVRPGEPTAMVWGADRDLATRSRRERLVAALQQTRSLNAFAVDEVGLGRYAAMLAHWQPPFIAGYASALYLLALFLQRHPEWAVRPRAVKSTAEVLHPHERQTVSQALQAPVYDFYGSREVNNLAAECPAHAGLHVNTWSRCLELVDGSGRAVGAGVPGRVLVTDLSNRALPMIRYENGDVGVWSAASCPCGRPFPLLERIIGRKSDFIHTPTGKLIHGEFFTHLFYGQRQVRAFQVRQEQLDALWVDVEMSEGELAPLAAALEPAMQAAVGSGVQIRFQRVQTIARSANGKHHFTRSQLNLPWPAAGEIPTRLE